MYQQRDIICPLKLFRGHRKNCGFLTFRDLRSFSGLLSKFGEISFQEEDFIFQLIRYARACSSYECFILRARRLPSKLLKQGYLMEHLKSPFRKFYCRYGDIIQQYEVSLSRMRNDILTNSDFPTDQTFYQFHDLDTELDLYRIMSGFHGAFATIVASERGPLTLPDTWFRPH